MSDTIQTLMWSLTGDHACAGYLIPPIGRDRPNDLLWQSIQRTSIEADLRTHFRITDPLWYGLWLDSPLTREQCLVLQTLFAEVAALARRYREHVQPFLEALRLAGEGAAVLHVELSPPGHVDLGWITTFVHCPRCKAEGAFPRWQPSYPVEAVCCAICGHIYSPAATYSMEREYFAPRITCSACGTAHRIKDFSADEIELLEAHHNFRTFCDELGWLRRVAAFYHRYPHMEKRVKPHFARLLESEDPRVHAELAAGVPFDHIDLSPEPTSAEPSGGWSEEDRDVLDFLRHNHFSLQPRWQFVTESIDKLRPMVDQQSVACPKCGAGLNAPPA